MKVKNLLIIGGVLVVGYLAYKKFMPKKSSMGSATPEMDNETKQVTIGVNSGIPNMPTQVMTAEVNAVPRLRKGIKG